jgi:transcriptional regulator with XRE-family HTH domain
MTSATNQGSDPAKEGNALIGERVHTLMWKQKRTQKELGAILNVDQGSISNRLRGKTNWTAVEVAAVAQWLQVPISDLMPEVELRPPVPPPTPPPGPQVGRGAVKPKKIRRQGRIDEQRNQIAAEEEAARYIALAEGESRLGESNPRPIHYKYGTLARVA